MLSLLKIKDTLKTNKFQLTDDQVKALRDYLYSLAQIQIENEKMMEGML
jgi:hypothetical protein